MQTYPHIWKGYYCDQDEDQNDKTYRLEFTSLTIFQNQGKKIKAEGKDQDGQFTIHGSVDGQNISFKYKSPKRQLDFKGIFTNETSMTGEWTEEGKNGSGNFNIEKIQLQQGWNGYYIQDDIHFQMKFQKMSVQSVPNGKVQGEGIDLNGAFVMEGTYDPPTNEVSFKKIYQDGLTWQYWGNLQGKEINGFWGFHKEQGMGQFKLFYLA